MCPVSFIGLCRLIFIFPPKMRRVFGSSAKYFPKIDAGESSLKYVSTVGSLVIVNHFPLELAYQHSFSRQFFIRETTRFVGDHSFNQNISIKIVVFPSSVELIGDLAFSECHAIRIIRFKKEFKFKIIGKNSF